MKVRCRDIVHFRCEVVFSYLGNPRLAQPRTQLIMTVLEGIVTKAGVMGKTVTVTVRRDSIITQLVDLDDEELNKAVPNLTNRYHARWYIRSC